MLNMLIPQVGDLILDVQGEVMFEIANTHGRGNDDGTWEVSSAFGVRGRVAWIETWPGWVWVKTLDPAS